jgi:hypothetical protein
MAVPTCEGCWRIADAIAGSEGHLTMRRYYAISIASTWFSALSGFTTIMGFSQD